MKRFIGAIVGVLAGLAAFAGEARAQSTAFTYQGQLKRTGMPANGLHDFRFRLFDAAAGGTQLGQTVCVDNVNVAAGVFTLPLDFGAQFASASPRHLEIEVRADTGLGCANATGFVLLTPRQVVTPAPLATHAFTATTATSLSAPDGAPANAVFVDNAGQVGVGTVTPAAPLHVVAPSGGPRPGEGLRVQGAFAGPENLAYAAFVNGAGVPIGYVGDGGGADNSVFLGAYVGDAALITPAGRVLTATAGGRVGIGTTTPQSTLEVRGDIRMGSSGQLRAAGGEEALRIVRGVVEMDPVSGANLHIVAGSGFSVTRTDPGHYTITFDPPFSGIPAVTAMARHPGADFRRFAMSFEGNASDQVRIFFYHPELEDAHEAPFQFIAVGPR